MQILKMYTKNEIHSVRGFRDIFILTAGNFVSILTLFVVVVVIFYRLPIESFQTCLWNFSIYMMDKEPKEMLAMG